MKNVTSQLSCAWSESDQFWWPWCILFLMFTWQVRINENHIFSFWMLFVSICSSCKNNKQIKGGKKRGGKWKKKRDINHPGLEFGANTANSENIAVSIYLCHLFVFLDAFRRETAHSRRIRLFESGSSEEEDDDGVIEVAREPAPSSSSGSRSRASRNNTTIDVEDISDEDLPSIPFTINGSVCTMTLFFIV